MPFFLLIARGQTFLFSIIIVAGTLAPKSLQDFQMARDTPGQDAYSPLSNELSNNWRGYWLLPAVIQYLSCYSCSPVLLVFGFLALYTPSQSPYSIFKQSAQFGQNKKGDR
jgi:hypothetical protein